MKIHELLLEYNQQLTVRNWGQKLLVKAKERERGLELTHEQLIQEFEKADPTRTKSYMKWIIREYLAGNFLIEDISYLNQVLTVYHQYKRQLPPEQRDINRLSRGDVNGIYLQITEPESGTGADTDLNIPGAKVIYSGPLGHLVIPETFEAAQVLGKGASWCTSHTRRLFNQYTAAGPLYIWLDRLSRGGDKIQFHFETASFSDELDALLSKEELGQLLGHPIIGKLFKKYEDTIKQSGDGEKLIRFWRLFSADIRKQLAPGKTVIEGSGGEWHFMNGMRHREHAPAIIHDNGTEYWYRSGALHRSDGPAVTHADGSEEWYLNGSRHRADGPASIDPDGYKAWFTAGQIHREDGPAIIHASGAKEWYINGRYHREDGPAVMWGDGRERWYLNGDPMTKEQHAERMRSRGKK